MAILSYAFIMFVYFIRHLYLNSIIGHRKNKAQTCANCDVSVH